MSLTQDCTIIILIIIIIYLLYKTRNITNNFTNTDTQNLIYQVYNDDLKSIKNLGELVSSILKPRQVTTYDLLGTETLTVTKNDILDLNGTVKISKDVEITKDLFINGQIKFTNKNDLAMELFPQYMIVAWASSIIPLGWAICDGKRYRLDKDGKAIADDYGTILTPDLRGRFILGPGEIRADSKTYYESKNYVMTKPSGSDANTVNMGGEDKHILIFDEMPRHDHAIDMRIKCEQPDFDDYTTSDQQKYGPSGYKCHLVHGYPQNQIVDPAQLPFVTQPPMVDYNGWHKTANYTVNVDKMSVGDPISTYATSYRANPHSYLGTGANATAGTGLTFKAQGRNIPHENMPPYRVMIYIMKL
jgi:microcystin-dependent protein